MGGIAVGLGSRFSDNSFVVMPQSGHVGINVTVAAGIAGVRCVPLLHTCGFCYYRFINMFGTFGCVSLPSDGAAVILHHIFGPSFIIGRMKCSSLNRIECQLINGGRITHKCNPLQIGTKSECTSADGSYTIWDRHTCQAGAGLEGIIADGSYTVRDFIGLTDSTRCQKQSSLFLIKQYTPVIAGIVWIVVIHINSGQTSTSIECVLADHSHTVWNPYAGQAFAAIERIITDDGYTIRNLYAGQAGAVPECIITDVGHTVRDNYTR